MSKEFELKPCPFCGAAAKLEQLNDHHGDYYNLGCSNHKCMAHHVIYTETPDEMPVEKAVATWNTRPDFAAGRALGRREMKGECKAKCVAERDEFIDRAANNDGSRESDFAFGSVCSAERIKDAIEAIPEEVEDGE